MVYLHHFIGSIWSGKDGCVLFDENPVKFAEVSSINVRVQVCSVHKSERHSKSVPDIIRHSSASYDSVCCFGFGVIL